MRHSPHQDQEAKAREGAKQDPDLFLFFFFSSRLFTRIQGNDTAVYCFSYEKRLFRPYPLPLPLFVVRGAVSRAAQGCAGQGSRGML